MEQGVMEKCVAALYQSVGHSLGGPLSPEDVCVLFHKVFHLHTGLEDAHSALQKVARDDSAWSCGEVHVLDVLLEMERERERREEIYWDLQFLNKGKLRHLYDTNTTDTYPTHLNRAPYHNRGARSSPTKKLKGEERGKVTGVCEWSLRKAARWRCARLVQDGVQGALPSLSSVQRSAARSHALGCVSMSELLLLVGVKYDTVTHTLSTEMLQDHHGLDVWETLLLWERKQREAELGVLWEETQESGDMLSWCDIPGAFRIYRCSEGMSLKGCPDWVKPREKSWSAISLLHEIQTCLDHEKKTLTDMAKRLDRETLQLMGLYTSLATIRAQRERVSHGALLAARQDWETWPSMRGCCTIDQAWFWLQEEDEEEEDKEEEEFPVFQQQVVLRCLVLSQEWERKCLLRILHRVSAEELQGPGEQKSPTEECSQQRDAALREGCVRRLKDIHNLLQLQPCGQPQTLPVQGCTPAQPQWGRCALVLMVELMELHRAQVSAVLSALLETTEQCLLELRLEYESELREPRLSCLFTLLTSNSCLNSDPCLGPSALIPFQNPPQDQTSGEPEDHYTENVCTGCGTTMTLEDLPYLEILCVSDTLDSPDTHTVLEELSAEPGGSDGAGAMEGSPRKTPQSYEKQASLITLAWSKPLDGDTEQHTGTTMVMSTAAEEPEEISVQEIAGSWEGKPVYTDCDTSGHVDFKSQCNDTATDQVDPSVFQSSTEGQPFSLTTGQKELVMKQSEGTDVNQANNTSITHTLPPEDTHTEVTPTATRGQKEAERRHGPPPVQEVHTHADLGFEGGEREAGPWVQRGPVARESDVENHNTPDITVEGDTTTVSVMERERTMRCLVDLQKKVELRQQRDRDRQLLRVQERLSIIQNRKSQEDLMGLKQTDRLRHLTHNLPLEDKSQQKTVVRERLDQLKRERSYVMQSKRNRNTAGFKELLGPVGLHSTETDDPAESLRLPTNAT